MFNKVKDTKYHSIYLGFRGTVQMVKCLASMT